MTPTTNNPDYAAVAEAMRTISDAVTADMKDFAAQQAASTVRLTAVRDRLQKSAKTPPATLQKLNQAISASNTLAQNIGGVAQRISQRPVVDPADLAIFGQVLDAKGAGAPGLYVRLTDSAGSLKIGSRAKTDASGDFSLVLKSCEVPAQATGLVVVVEDANGARLAASDAVTPKAGSPVYVELTLSAPAAKVPSTSPQQPPSPKA